MLPAVTVRLPAVTVAPLSAVTEPNLPTPEPVTFVAFTPARVLKPVTFKVVPTVRAVPTSPPEVVTLFASISAPDRSRPPQGVNVPVTVTLLANVVLPVILGTVRVVAVRPATVVAPVTPKVPPIVVLPEICGAPVITPVVRTRFAPTVVLPVLDKDAALTLVALRSNVPATVK